jgi:hypothetical protein
MIFEKAAAIKSMDYFGCGGCPWVNAKGGKQECEGTVLLGQGEK